jgi:hypothetical protein
MNKGQAEIMGLVLIVLLIAVGFLLYVKFGLTKQATDVRAQYEQSNLGQTFLNSIVKAEVPCAPGDARVYSLQKLLEQTASGKPKCSGSQEALITAFITQTLTKTLDEWGLNYQFRLVIRRGTQSASEFEQLSGLIPNFTNAAYPVQQRCNPRTDHSQDTYSFQLPPSFTQTIELQLLRC